MLQQLRRWLGLGRRQKSIRPPVRILSLAETKALLDAVVPARARFELDKDYLQDIRQRSVDLQRLLSELGERVRSFNEALSRPKLREADPK